MDELEKITKQIAKKYKPEKIILFGSYAWGKPDPESDIDLFIIKKTRKNRVKRGQEVYSLIDYSCPVDIIVYTPEEIKECQDIGDFFIKRILNKGKLIYARQ